MAEHKLGEGPFLPKNDKESSEEEKKDNECNDACYNYLQEKSYYFVQILIALIFGKCAINTLLWGMYSNVFGLAVMIVGLFFFVIAIKAFFQVNKTDPGDGSSEITDCSEKEVELAKQRSEFAQKNKLKCVDVGYPVRYCCECQKIKKERSYHCKKCKKCVDMRDHHCSWVGNCIGRKNFKFFILFIYYITISLFFGSIVFCWSLFKDTSVYIFMILSDRGYSLLFLFNFLMDVTLFALTFALFISIMYLCFIYTKSVLINETSMETIEFDRYELIKTKLYPIPNYNKGKWRNVEEVMGKGWRMLSPFSQSYPIHNKSN